VDLGFLRLYTASMRKGVQRCHTACTSQARVTTKLCDLPWMPPREPWSPRERWWCQEGPHRSPLILGGNGSTWRRECKISSYRIDQRTGALGLLGTVELPTDPCYLSTDRRGKFLLADPARAVGEIFVCPKPRAQQHRWFCRRRCHRTLEVDRTGCKRGRTARLQPRSRGQVPLCRWPRIGPAGRIPYRS